MPIVNGKPDPSYSYNYDGIDQIIEVIKSCGGNVHSFRIENNYQDLFSVGGGYSKNITGPSHLEMSHLEMDVTFQLPIKIDLPSTITVTKKVKENLTDEQIIQRYNEIMEKRAQNEKAEEELEYDHIDV